MEQIHVGLNGYNSNDLKGGFTGTSCSWQTFEQYLKQIVNIKPNEVISGVILSETGISIAIKSK